MSQNLSLICGCKSTAFFITHNSFQPKFFKYFLFICKSAEKILHFMMLFVKEMPSHQNNSYLCTNYGLQVGCV